MRHHYPQNDQVGASTFCIMTLTRMTLCKMGYCGSTQTTSFLWFLQLLLVSLGAATTLSIMIFNITLNEMRHSV